VTVRDNGGTVNGGVDAITRTFTVTVAAVNDAPTLDPIGPVTLPEDAGLQTVNLAGIGAGPDELQTLTVTATSSNPGLIPDPTVSYTSPNATGLELHAGANRVGHGGHHGDGDGTMAARPTAASIRSRARFTVTVTAVNDAPTLDPIGP
jgi:hypothetical protein